MMTLQVVLLLSVGITFAAAANGYNPDCARCEYYNGIGFLKTPYCATYVMCFKNPYTKDYYRHQTMCCPEDTEWDQEHLSCKRGKCNDDRLYCPNATTTTDLPCPLKKHSETEYAYKATHEVMSCPYGSTFDEEACTCIFLGPYKTPCWKILHFDFNNTYDSDSCYNFAAGDPYGYPTIAYNMLCLNGVDQFFSIPFLNNWFAWNPIGKTFTLCFWLKAKYYGDRRGQTAGVLSTNCRFEADGSVLEIWLENGEMIVSLAGIQFRTNKFPNYDYWDLICITFDKGHYILYYNAAHIHEEWVPSPWAINSHSDTTLGYVEGKGLPLEGYFDDFCFWTHVLQKPEIVHLFKKGPSSLGLISSIGETM